MQTSEGSDKMVFMTVKTSSARTGYTSREFGSLFQIYSANVYTGLFRSFSFTEKPGAYQMAFHEEAGKPALLAIEKRALGPDRALFVALTPTQKGAFAEVARSEKLENFVEQVKSFIDKVKMEKRGQLGGGNVTSIYGWYPGRIVSIYIRKFDLLLCKW